MLLLRLIFILTIFSITNLSAQEPCSFHLVVLGSSTAAGTGPSSPDSTWVNKYRKYVESINERFQVTNLAIGGTTTYHIMPDDNAVADRPAPNTTNNISQAIRLGASAILVNMPSNDTSNGFLPAEQLNNFATLAATADAANIPIWICTTQPKNYTDQLSIDRQLEVKDAILATYGNHALDFWTEFASSNNTLNPAFDSGDGTHMNDAAHAILVQKVIDKTLIEEASFAHEYIEIGISDLALEDYKFCGGDMILSGKLTNNGQTQNEEIVIEFSDLANYLGSTSISNLRTCESLTFEFGFNTEDNTIHRITANLENTDPVPGNNSAFLDFETIPKPTIETQSTTFCYGQEAVLNASTPPPFQINWYDDALGENLLGNGFNFTTEPLFSNFTYYAQAFVEPFNVSDSLLTTDVFNKDWNGVMIDLTPKKDLVIDSLEIRIKDLGSQGITAYYKQGTYLGSENTPEDWTLWGTDVAEVNEEGQYHVVNFGELSLSSGLKFGIYLHMNNSGARLSYNDALEAVNYETNELILSTGTGITHTFAENYFPRDWNGRVHYHHKVEAPSCLSDLTPAEAILSDPIVTLGEDISILVGEQWEIDLGDSFSSYTWNDQAGGQTFTFEATEDNIGTTVITVTVTDEFGCTASDEINITVLSNPNAVHYLNNNRLLIFPNPAKDNIFIKGKLEDSYNMILTDLNGRILRQGAATDKISLENISSGLVFIKIYDSLTGKYIFEKVVVGK